MTQEKSLELVFDTSGAPCSFDNSTIAFTVIAILYMESEEVMIVKCCLDRAAKSI